MSNSSVLDIDAEFNPHTMHGKEKQNHPVRETEMGSGRDYKSSIENLKEPYNLAKADKWEEFHKYFSDNRALLTELIDVNKSTPLHRAAFSGKPKIFEKLLELLPRNPGDNGRLLEALKKENESGNTVLHEVAAAGESKMAEIIYERLKQEEVEEQQLQSLLLVRNKRGETPVFRAAAHGRTKLLKFFHDQKISLRNHSHRSMDDMSILHVAVVTQNFGTAIWLLRREEQEYKTLVNEKEGRGMTAFQLLAKMPSAFSSQNRMGYHEHLIYFLLPNHQQCSDIESCEAQDVLKTIWYAIWKFLAREWNWIDEVWKKKETNNLAMDLAKRLAEEDYSWVPDVAEKLGQVPHSKDKEIITQEQPDNKNTSGGQVSGNGKTNNLHTPLLMAAANGITEIVEAIIEQHPQAIEHVSEDKQNILFMAVKHRQRGIYRIIKRNGVLNTLAQQVDNNGYTLLRYAEDFKQELDPPYALLLQSELNWFQRVEKLVPREYTMAVRHNGEDQTPILLFEKGHHDLLQKSQKWIKEIAQSCSTVAVLAATVVFAAAFTVPGGTDDQGLPIFLRRRIFLLFTVTDVLSLACSLASVVMFLSILTSHFDMWEFHKILPRKMAAGFMLLFLSLAITMLSFSAAILIDLKSEENRWTSGFTYTAAFYPVAFLGLVQFPLYVGIKDLLWSLFKTVKKGTPRHLQATQVNKARISMLRTLRKSAPAFTSLRGATNV